MGKSESKDGCLPPMMFLILPLLVGSFVSGLIVLATVIRYVA